MYKILRAKGGEQNEEGVFLIKKMLNKMKKTIERVPEDRKFLIEENKKIINILESILYFNQIEQKR